MVAAKWKVVAGAATVAVALGAGTAIAQTTPNDPPGSSSVTDDQSVDSPQSADTGDSVESGDSADTGDSPDTP